MDINNLLQIHQLFLSKIEYQVEDLTVIWKRFLENREKLNKIDPAILSFLINRDYQNEQLKKLSDKEKILSNKLRVDIKSIFLFGDILLYKLTLLSKTVLGHTRKIQYRSFTTFLDSIKKENLKIYKQVGLDLEKIDAMLGTYRDFFIVHALKPYQESTTAGVYTPEFILSHSAHQLEEFDYEEFNRLVDKLSDILPENDKRGRPLKEKSDPRTKVEVLFKNLFKINDNNLKSKAIDIIRHTGVDTPDIYYLILTVSRVIANFLDCLIEEVKLKYIDKTPVKD